MQVPLSDPGIGVSGDALEQMNRNASIGKPGQPRVPEIVPTQVLEPEPVHDVAPKCHSPKNSHRDPAAPRTTEHPRISLVGDAREPTRKHRPQFLDDRNRLRPLPFRISGWCGLAGVVVEARLPGRLGAHAWKHDRGDGRDTMPVQLRIMSGRAVRTSPHLDAYRAKSLYISRFQEPDSSRTFLSAEAAYFLRFDKDAS